MVLVSNLRAVSVFCRQAALTDKTSQYFGTTPPATDSRDCISTLICRTAASGVPTAVRILITQFLSFQQHLAWQSTRVVSCVTLCPGGPTPCSRLESNLRFVEIYRKSGLSRKRSYICTRLQKVTFQMVLIPYALSQGLRIWHVLRLPLQ